MGIHVRYSEKGMLSIVKLVHTLIHRGPFNAIGGKDEICVGPTTTPSGKPRYLLAVDVFLRVMAGQNVNRN